MERYYTIPEIAHRLTTYSQSRLITQEAVNKWVQQGRLRAERIPSNVRGIGKYPYWIKENQLKTDLNEMGYDAEKLFAKII
ncbi:hypothetical protein D3C81_668060 [compost metagenome]